MKDNQGNKLPTISQAIEFRIEQYGHARTQAAKKIGITTLKLSQIIRGHKAVSRNLMWKLYRYGIPPVVLIQPQRKSRSYFRSGVQIEDLEGGSLGVPSSSLG